MVIARRPLGLRHLVHRMPLRISPFRVIARRGFQERCSTSAPFVVVGDDDWGVVRAAVIDDDRESGSLVLRLLGELVEERPGELSRPA